MQCDSYGPRHNPEPWIASRNVFFCPGQAHRRRSMADSPRCQHCPLVVPKAEWDSIVPLQSWKFVKQSISNEIMYWHSQDKLAKHARVWCGWPLELLCAFGSEVKVGDRNFDGIIKLETCLQHSGLLSDTGCNQISQSWILRHPASLKKWIHFFYSNLCPARSIICKFIGLNSNKISVISADFRCTCNMSWLLGSQPGLYICLREL